MKYGTEHILNFARPSFFCIYIVRMAPFLSYEITDFVVSDQFSITSGCVIALWLVRMMGTKVLKKWNISKGLIKNTHNSIVRVTHTITLLELWCVCVCVITFHWTCPISYIYINLLVVLLLIIIILGVVI